MRPSRRNLHVSPRTARPWYRNGACIGKLHVAWAGRTRSTRMAALALAAFLLWAGLDVGSVAWGQIPPSQSGEAPPTGESSEEPSGVQERPVPPVQQELQLPVPQYPSFFPPAFQSLPPAFQPTLPGTTEG